MIYWDMYQGLRFETSSITGWSFLLPVFMPHGPFQGGMWQQVLWLLGVMMSDDFDALIYSGQDPCL